MTDREYVTNVYGDIGLVDRFEDGDPDRLGQFRVHQLTRALELLDTLGWPNVEVSAVENDGRHMLVFQPDGEATGMDDGEQSALFVCPIRDTESKLREVPTE